MILSLARRLPPGRPKAGAGKPGQDSPPDLWYKNDRHVWHNGYGPAVATDFINRFQEDVQLMKLAGLTHYRTSINWSRFLTDYENVTVDEEYAAYYDQLFDALLANGITPMICLEHYELPGYLLEKYGGWGSKTVVELFVRYAEKVFARYHPKVTRWFTFNEPIVVQTRVYLDALRWPYEQNTSTWMQWNYHKVLATASVVKRFRELGYPGTVGCILNPEVTYPRSRAPMTCARRRSTIYSTTACSSTRWCTASGRRSFSRCLSSIR